MNARVKEAIEASKSWTAEKGPLYRGYDPYNTADTHWWTFLVAVNRGLIK